MMPIRIIDRSFNLIGEIDNYTSLIFTRKYSNYGDFEIHIGADVLNADKLQKGNIIVLGGNGRKSGIILHREINQNENGEEFLIKGYTLGSILNRRITIPPVNQAYDTINSFGETAIKHYVDVNCVNPIDVKRKISNLIIAEDKGRGKQVSYSSRLKQLDEEVSKICELSGLGYEIYLDFNNFKFVFDILQGRDLTVNQNILPPVIFSIDFDNIQNQEYTDSDIGYKNYGYVGGQGEGEERNIIEVGDEITGFDRIETFIDARDINENEDLAQRGIQKLLEFKNIQSFTSEIINNVFEYEKDWNLGDIVTCQNRKWGITMDTRITEVKEIYENTGLKLEVTFGNSIPTLTDKIKKVIDNPVIETPSETKYDERYYTKTEVDKKIEQTIGTSTFIYTQIAPISVWNINHNLNKRPSVTIIDSSGNTVIGDVQYIDENNVKITFSSAFAGNAYLN
ncbi:siphovirus ReqiPepy6 Gp37-like family protein [Clostridium sp. SYSU_GA19001]|uniref:siphovirus ReqiPepy6 Gp37-like family protein n=1 Tax=Clostridium caldaquaticum TaxID=2940653 RepID=UPI00207766A0|nr:siphovirus ReqiPepy6 Gp37-like family protein [Clostridium caldaquaticum]MCM8710546.1 siphovirus ReqiPepy6 Gp37-like family protein [Clostridium caldaquaticum]